MASLREKLKTEADKAAKEFAKKLAANMEPKLIRSAEKGYSAFQINIDLEPEDTRHLYYADILTSELESHLDGVSVSLEEEEYSNLLGLKYTRNKLVFRWGKK